MNCRGPPTARAINRDSVAIRGSCFHVFVRPNRTRSSVTLAMVDHSGILLTDNAKWFRSRLTLVLCFQWLVVTCETRQTA